MIKANANVHVAYLNASFNNITQYLNEFELSNTVGEIESTNLTSTSQTYIPSMTEHSLSLSGDWLTGFDDIFGPDAVTPVARTVKISFLNPTMGTGNDVVTYTWTNAAFITGYNISASSGDKITHSATLRLSGPPTRSVATDFPTT
jgi:hypothetical protein